MQHPAYLTPPAAILVAGHPGDLPARRGHGLCRVADWHRSVSVEGPEYRRAKVQPITLCEQGTAQVRCQ